MSYGIGRIISGEQRRAFDHVTPEEAASVIGFRMSRATLRSLLDKRKVRSRATLLAVENASLRAFYEALTEPERQELRVSELVACAVEDGVLPAGEAPFWRATARDQFETVAGIIERKRIRRR